MTTGNDQVQNIRMFLNSENNSINMNETIKLRFPKITMTRPTKTTYVLDFCVGVVSHGQDHVWRRSFTIDPNNLEGKSGIFQEPHRVPASGLVLNSLNDTSLQNSGLTLFDMMEKGEYKLSDTNECNDNGNTHPINGMFNINDLSPPMKLLRSTPRFFRVDVHKNKPRRHPYHQRNPKIHNICGSMMLSDIDDIFKGGSSKQGPESRQPDSGGLHHVMHTNVTCFGPSVDIYTVSGTVTFRKYGPESLHTSMFFKVNLTPQPTSTKENAPP